MQAPTPHIEAKKGEFAPVVIMPGDPMRAKFIAENFLTDVKLINKVRGELAYTGLYKGKQVSVMSSGMGFPSMLIYSTELFEAYDVKTIIRVGSAGSVSSGLKLRDLLIVQSASSQKGLLDVYVNNVNFSTCADFNLLNKTKIICENFAISGKLGNVLSANLFYDETKEYASELSKYGIHALEMEASALYFNAMRHNKKALALCSISDELFSGKSLSSKEREQGFINMIKISLELAIVSED